MNSVEYLEQCKNKLNVDTNYKLALQLEIEQNELAFYATGKRLPSLYAVFKISECLGIDPAIIMADIASESEKNPKKRDYFKSFMSTCTKTATGKTLKTVLLLFTIGALGSGVLDALRIMSRYVHNRMNTARVVNKILA